MNTSKSLDEILEELQQPSKKSYPGERLKRRKEAATAIVEAVEGIYGDSDGLREFASTPTNQVVNPSPKQTYYQLTGGELKEKSMDSEQQSTDQAPDLSFGEKAVGLTFNPGGSKEVRTLKEQVATFINFCNREREASDNPEVKRMYSVAITEAQTAQMWAVKAATWSN